MAFSAYSMSFACLSKPSALRIQKGLDLVSYFPAFLDASGSLASRPQNSLFDHSWFRAWMWSLSRDPISGMPFLLVPSLPSGHLSIQSEWIFLEVYVI
jgi:hypothetical protein